MATVGANRRVYEFIEATPTSENHLRGIVLFGRNVASYKFALAKSLIDLGREGREEISLDELARPFSRHLCDHLANAPKQATSRSSKFLGACRSFNAGEISQDALWSTTAALGFVNVIDAFHVVGDSDVGMRFFHDERRGSARGIRLTEDLQALAFTDGDQALAEIEARWCLVESAWEMGVANSLIEFDSETGLLVPSSHRRRSLSSARDTLNGYQKGSCFYCYRKINSVVGSDSEVDHLFPHVLMRRDLMPGLDQIWNLVLACVDCNRGPQGKFDRTPSPTYVERLATRNDYLIESKLPIRETLMLQTGKTQQERDRFLQNRLTIASSHMSATWETQAMASPAF